MVASLSSIDDLASLALCVFSVHFLFLFRSFSCVVLGGFRQRRRGPALARAKHAAATSGGRRSDSWPQSPCNRHSSKRVRILSWVEFVTKQLVMMSESRFFFPFPPALLNLFFSIHVSTIIYLSIRNLHGRWRSRRRKDVPADEGGAHLPREQRRDAAPPAAL